MRRNITGFFPRVLLPAFDHVCLFQQNFDFYATSQRNDASIFLTSGCGGWGPVKVEALSEMIYGSLYSQPVNLQILSSDLENVIDRIQISKFYNCYEIRRASQQQQSIIYQISRRHSICICICTYIYDIYIWYQISCIRILSRSDDERA